MRLSAELRGLAEEQAALRRVATLAARAVCSEELFAAVTQEVGQLLHVRYAHLGRYGPNRTVTFVAAWGPTDGVLPVGTQLKLGGKNVSTLVFETRRPARIDSDAGDSSPISVVARERGIRSVGTPVIVEGGVWGVMVVGSAEESPLPPDTESRLEGFTELLATAVANAETRAGLARLAEEQAALRRVAMLVAGGAPQVEVFAAVTEEVGQLLCVEYACLERYEPDGKTTSVVAVWERADASGPPGVAGHGYGVDSGVGTPILVEGRRWGVLSIYAPMGQPMPADSEARLDSFSGLLATAIANAESRGGLARLAEEQAALRRVATAVARAMPPEEVVATVCKEIERLLPVDFVHIGRYEPDDTITVLATSGSTAKHFPAGARWSLGGRNLTTIVSETGRPGRIDGYADAFGPLGDTGRDLGIRSSVGTPIIVEGRVWGVIIAGSTVQERLAADTEPRLESFTELVATAIANAESHSALAASRARIVAAADESRRRIERDLHDGAQQRLVHAVIALKLARQAHSSGATNAAALVAEALRHAEQASSELRELAHGILPAVLTRGGLRAGVEALVSRVSLPVRVDMSVERLPAGVEATAYFVISEALTNVVKHARAGSARVWARVERGELRVEVRDDGIGGAGGDQSTGLGGLQDRVAALAGRLELDSPPGRGTRVYAILPIPFQD